MDGVIGRSAGCHQPDDRIDNRFLVDAMTERPIIVAGPADIGDTVGSGTSQLGAKPGSGVDERGGGHVQSHRLEHHLVRIGRAVKGTRAGVVIACTLCFEQLGGADLSFGEKLADALLLLVRQARRHRPSRHEYRRQMAEAKRADQQAGDDLVANAEQQHAFEHRMAQRDCGRQGDGVAAEQRQIHAGLTLRHPVAHRRDAARDLRRRPDFARGKLDDFGVATIGLMRRKHVVVGGYDTDVHRAAAHDHGLVVACRCKTVREVPTRKIMAVGPRFALAGDER